MGKAGLKTGLKTAAKEETAAETRLTGIVERLYYSRPGFSAGKLKTDASGSVSFAGPVYFEAESFVTLFGRYEDDAKFGRQFKAARFEFAGGGASELDEAGLAHYLAVSREFTGIGPSKAKKIAAHFGAGFGEALEEAPEQVARVAGLQLAQVLAIRDSWRASAEKNATATWLASFGLTAHQINSIMAAFGNGTRRILTEDPYRMIDVIDGFGFVRTDEIARKMGVAKEQPSRLRAGLMHGAKQELDAGHIWTDRGELLRSANAILCLDGLDGLSRIEQELDKALAEDGTLEEDAAGRIALVAVAKMEREIAGFVARAGKRANPVEGLEVPGVGLGIGPGLNEDQQAALALCLRRQFVVVTGGAGSGKTFLIGAIVRRYLEAGRKLLGLCAPTGKAARRVADSMAALGLENRDTATIHRLLGFRGGDGVSGVWGHDPGNPLAADLVVCDEASMLDVGLAWRLLRAIDWERTAVVFVGDPNQLPPIGAGNVLRDLLTTGLVPVAALTKCVRQAGPLKRNSAAILEGHVESPVLAQGTCDAPWYVLDSGAMSDAAACADFVVSLASERAGNLTPPPGFPRARYDLLRDVQVLTPTHKGALGTTALNIRLQAALQCRLFGVTVDPVPDGKRPPFLRGDRIIQTKNDYKIGVMNGTLGWIRDVDEETGSLWVDFDGLDAGALEIPKKGGGQSCLAHAYALTVHKYQGSEVPVAICVVHKSHSFQQHQAMVYTAVTRARHVAILVGDNWGIRNAAKKRLVERRRTFLALERGPWVPGEAVAR